MTDVQIKAVFSANLLHLRTQKRLSQAAMAKALTINRCTYQYYESGKTMPLYDTTTAIARFFLLTVDDLLLVDLKTREVVNS